MYFVGIAIIIVGALIVNKITGEGPAQGNAYFILELPEYRIPSIKRAFISMMSRAKAFIVKAATIILVCNAAVQIMQTFSWNFQVVEEGMESTSVLCSSAGSLGFGVAAAAAMGLLQLWERRQVPAPATSMENFTLVAAALHPQWV